MYFVRKRSGAKGDVTHSNNRGHKLDEEIGKLQQRWVKVVKEINEQAFDVGTIVILGAA